MKISRRGFIVTVVGVGAGLGAGLYLRRRNQSEEAIILLKEIAPDEEIAEIVGKAYLKNRPEEADPQLLLERIFSGDERDFEDSSFVAKGLKERIRRDFEEHRTIELNRWLLSETEARVFALISIAGAVTA